MGVGFDVPEATALLARTPTTVRALLAGLPDAWVRNGYGAGTWSPFEVLGHLIHAEKTDWIPRAEIILGHGESRAFDPFDRAGHERDIRGKTLEDLLGEFDRWRGESLRRLAAFGDLRGRLDMPGLHPALGRVTLRNLLATWVVHDLNHVAQMCKGMAFLYRGEVGAWERYLSILAPPAPR
ncbi:MAG: DinB family protein [Phycisphaerales bacterium]|nr:DinB family protein [Phycisphaerales bacterium]